MADHGQSGARSLAAIMALSIGLVALDLMGSEVSPMQGLRVALSLVVLIVAARRLTKMGRPRDSGVRSPDHDTTASAAIVPTARLTRSRAVLFQCIEDTRVETAALADDKGVHLQVEYVTQMPVTIETDPARLRLALGEVLRAAINATRRGTVLLLAYCWREEEQMSIELVVMDAGSGLAPTELQTMFDKWESVAVDEDLQRIARAREALLDIDGDLKVRSWPGIGSVFRLELPAGPDEGIVFFEPPRREEPLPGSAADEPFDTDLSGLRILVVDDVAVNRRLLERILQKWNANVTLVDGGQEAAARFLSGTWRPDSFDAILMDIHMPDMDGFEAASRIRSVGFVRPILAVTAGSNPGGREAYLAGGFDEYIPKPVDREQLGSALRTLCAEPIRSRRKESTKESPDVSP